MLTLGRWRFTPGLVPTLAAVAMVALTLSLSRWQFNRADEKTARQALLEAREREPVLSLAASGASAEALVYRHVRAEGTYKPEGQVFIDNRQHAGRAGFHVMTPLMLDGGGAVLVNRGWIARTNAYPQPPAAPVPEGRITVAGLASIPPPRVLELSKETIAGSVWQNLSMARYRELMRIDALPVVLLAEPPSPGLVAVHDKPDLGIAKHQEYALTWLALATTVVGLWLALNLKRQPQ
ncbi:SURF1 family protein [Usitatibacter palustris]|uniref:SURF1-like protein n=1 Tax=Usitatibacter palustris TaxID=2732487 RepID=A0A6M4H514_9PROT|nr:SURF1 family protein [Usitatibacter palustris]QJR13624.1 hypothetical protein DSM104440_00408 [Usitatibacter palustris]